MGWQKGFAVLCGTDKLCQTPALVATSSCKDHTPVRVGAWSSRLGSSLSTGSSWQSSIFSQASVTLRGLRALVFQQRQTVLHLSGLFIFFMGYSLGYAHSFCYYTKPVIFFSLVVNVKLQTRQLHISRRLRVHNPKHGWKLEILKSLPSAGGWWGEGTGTKCWIWRWVVKFGQEGVCHQWREVLGWKPSYGWSSENWATGSFCLTWISRRGMAAQGCAAPWMLEHLSLKGRELSGSARVPAVSRWWTESFWGAGRRGQQGFMASELFLERKTFYCPVLCCYLAWRSFISKDCFQATDARWCPARTLVPMWFWIAASVSKMCQGDNKTASEGTPRN